EQLIGVAEVPALERRVARRRLAERARAAGQLAEAEAHLWAAVELSPTGEQPALLVELEENYRQAERWADLAVVLAHHIRVVDDEPVRLELELQRVTMLTRALGTPKLALDAAQAATEQHGREPRLLDALADRARAATLASEALELARAEAAPLPRGGERRAALRLVVERARAAGHDEAEREALATSWSDGDAGEERSRLLSLF